MNELKIKKIALLQYSKAMIHGVALLKENIKREVNLKKICQINCHGSTLYLEKIPLINTKKTYRVIPLRIK